MFVFILCVLAALTQFVCCLMATLTLCCLTKKFQHVCNMFLPADITHGMCCLKFNTQHVFCFSTLRLLCQNSMRRVLSPTFKQHGPCVETTSCQDSTQYVPQQHTGVLNLHPVMCIGVLYCPRCVKKTRDEIQMLFQHMLQQTTHDGDTHLGYFNMAVLQCNIYQQNRQGSYHN